MAFTDAQTGRVLDALGNATRRQILELLRDTPLAVGTIAQQLPISRPAVSKQLRILEEAGLVTYEMQGTRNIFSIEPAGFASASWYVAQFWDEALTQFKQFVEAADDGRQSSE